MTKPIRTRRIATVKATGRRFLVDRLHLPKDGSPAKAYCLGDIVKAKETSNGGAQITYDGTRVFLLDAVEISEVVFTFEFSREMWREAMACQAADRGVGVAFRLSRNGRTTRAVRDVLTADELLNRAVDAEARGEMELAKKLLAAAERASC